MNDLIYEGEYLNEEITVKGTLFWIEGKLKFDVEYINGKRWNGKGREFLNVKEGFLE